jgi:hypothetical protein
LTIKARAKAASLVEMEVFMVVLLVAMLSSRCFGDLVI